MITFQDIKENKEINTYIESADQYLANIGYTEHSFKHVLKCSIRCAEGNVIRGSFHPPKTKPGNGTAPPKKGTPAGPFS